ncbi:hypothetical protein F4780DRAFT_728996 [Xylariomycetidae sp. FL0641]|nr:hypothetical protein F4780DRAFT_728996 [Xylariomycetidae sp. FL0641]
MRMFLIASNVLHISSWISAFLEVTVFRETEKTGIVSCGHCFFRRSCGWMTMTYVGIASLPACFQIVSAFSETLP